MIRKFFSYCTLPLSVLSAMWFKLLRSGYKDLPPVHKRFTNKIGVYPVINHYYDPFYDVHKIRREAYEEFKMFDFIDYALSSQLSRFGYFKNKYFEQFISDFLEIEKQVKDLGLSTGNFSQLDAFLYYCQVIESKPEKVIEIGSGISTLVCVKAIKRVQAQVPSYLPELYCVEPFEMPWLENLREVQVLRSKLEDCFDEVVKLFQENIFLFIDSSHIIKPQSDLIYIFSKLLPSLKRNTLVHFHDIYLPYDYPFDLISNSTIFSNEQYMLGAFLTHNEIYELIFSNYYITKEFEDIRQSFQFEYVPKSLWLRKTK